MIHILIQILRWVMQPKVWRFVGFASTVVGLLCYALSSSFNYLFGHWNLLKIFLYGIFSFIICLVILFAKRFQHSRSLRFKAHAAFMVLTITSIYSFFFDKVMNGKPDAYSLISCAAFAIMSLSLSRQTQCGFEIDLLYFFLGCLIVQLMKIKLLLFFLGIGFSYSLIILRSFFTSIDAARDDQYSQLQDSGSVVLNMDSLQLVTVDIASASNGIDSPELVISTDIGSMMEKLATSVKALENENSKIIQMLLEHVKKYVEQQSQLVVSDPNFMMDALKPEIIADLEKTAKVMVSAGFEKDFFDVYNNCRRKCLKQCLMQRLFKFQKLTIDDVHNMSWKDLENTIERWIRAFNVALKILFPSERQLCDRVFFGFASAADFSFTDICKESTTQLLNFSILVASESRSPERLFKILEVFETMRDLIPEFESLFCDQYSVHVRNEVFTIWNRLREAIKGFFIELKNLIGRDLTKVTDLGGGLHPITQRVMNYIHAVSRSRKTLEQVFDDSSLSEKMQMIVDMLESNLEEKANCYEDPSLGYIFLMNNKTYIVQMTEDNELGTLLGDEWLLKHTWKVGHYHQQYQKTLGTMASTLVHDYFQSKIYGIFNNTNKHIGDEIDERNVEAPEGSKTYGRDVPEIEASPFQLGERKTESHIEIRTIVLLSAATLLGNTNKMPAEDGLIWRQYGKKKILGFEYPRRYYRCIHMKSQFCCAKKKVQQLGDNPNVFEVTYNGGHSCRMALKIPSLILPARRILRDVIQTNISSSSTTYSEWLSSGTAKYLDSIPKAKLAAPVDGGHHPMMDNVVGYLVSAIQQKVVNNGDEAFLQHTEGTMELLESILASKSEEYTDRCLRHFFMMNNWRYLEMANKRILGTIFSNVWFQRNRAKVQQKLELYRRDSWGKVLEFLKLDINDTMEINCAIDSMKQKLSLFNMNFTETCRVQCTWSVHDEKLRKEIIESLKNTLLPAYGIFIGRFHDFLKNNAYEYIEYGMFDIQDILDSLFLGNKKDR